MICKRKMLFIIPAVIIILAGCSPKHSEIIVAEFGGKKVTMGEFEKAFSRNSGGMNKKDTDSIKQYENFLNLYVNFKMKLEDAKERGYDNDSSLISELMDYKKKVGVTYILEKQLVEPNVRRLWEMRKYEYRVSHIMIRPDSTGEEGAIKKAQAIMDSIKAGRKFEELVFNNTADNFSKNIGGDIYYITAGMLIPEFEEAVYSTPVGQVHPHIVKTKYGYHIIKVTEKRERIPQIRASHILVDFYNESGDVDTVAARLRMDTVIMRLNNGEDFALLAKQYSDDAGSKENGGDLNYFERRQMVKEFDEVAFNLKVGEISPVVKTSYGYHVIKVTERKPYPSYEEEKERLKLTYKQLRYNNDYDTLTTSLKTKYGFRINTSTLNELSSYSDSTRLSNDYMKATWRDSIKDKVIYSFTTLNVTVDTLVNNLILKPEFSGKYMTKDVLSDMIKKHSAEVALELAAFELEKENAEFASLMEEYKNGIFIFKLQDDEIWGKIVLDSARLYQHWEKTKDKYRWPDRVEFAEIFSRTDSLIKVYYERLKSGESFDDIAANNTERPGFKEKLGRHNIADVNSSQLAIEANKLNKEGDFSEPFANSGGYSIVKLIKKDPARMKTFEEAKPEVSGSFQEEESKRLENEYISKLKNKYKPVYYYGELVKAFKGEN